MRILILSFLLSSLVLTNSYADEASSDWRGSLMFDVNEQNFMRSEIDNYLENQRRLKAGIQNPIAPTDVLAPIAPVKQIVVESPSYFLGSIVEIPKKGWSVWVNGKKIKQGEGDGKLTAMSITSDHASFVWNEPNLDLASPEWRQKVNTKAGTQDAKLILENGILVDDTAKKVYFLLMTNQTFVSRTMEIVEGRVEAEIAPPLSHPSSTPPLPADGAPADSESLAPAPPVGDPFAEPDPASAPKALERQ